MKFVIEKIAKTDFESICVYDKAEYSLHMENCCTDGSLAIDNLYATIDFDIASKRVMGVSGYIGELAKAEKISFDEISCVAGARLFLEVDKTYASGIAYEIGFKGRTVWDPKKKYFAIIREDIRSVKEWYFIANNICVAVKDGELSGILIEL